MKKRLALRGGSCAFGSRSLRTTAYDCEAIGVRVRFWNISFRLVLRRKKS